MDSCPDSLPPVPLIQLSSRVTLATRPRVTRQVTPVPLHRLNTSLKINRAIIINRRASQLSNSASQRNHPTPDQTRLRTAALSSHRSTSKAPTTRNKRRLTVNKGHGQVNLMVSKGLQPISSTEGSTIRLHSNIPVPALMVLKAHQQEDIPADLHHQANSPRSNRQAHSSDISKAAATARRRDQAATAEARQDRKAATGKDRRQAASAGRHRRSNSSTIRLAMVLRALADPQRASRDLAGRRRASQALAGRRQASKALAGRRRVSKALVDRHLASKAMGPRSRVSKVSRPSRVMEASNKRRKAMVVNSRASRALAHRISRVTAARDKIGNHGS